MKILLVCSAGMSTSLVESKMKKLLKKREIEGKVQALDSGSAKSILEKWDIIMLGPQVSFMESEFKEITNKPVVIIPPQFYAMAKSEEILEIAIKKLGGK